MPQVAAQLGVADAATLAAKEAAEAAAQAGADTHRARSAPLDGLNELGILCFWGSSGGRGRCGKPVALFITPGGVFAH